MGMVCPVEQFSTMAEILADFKQDESRVVGVVNKSARQKDALVDCREDVSDAIAAPPDKGLELEYNGKKVKLPGFGFARKMKTKKVEGKPDQQVPDWTDQEHIDAFIASVASGAFTVPGFTPTGTDAAAKSASVRSLIQTRIIDAHGPYTLKGSLLAEARVRKPKTAPQWLLQAATGVINACLDPKTGKFNPNAKGIAKWRHNCEKGYETEVPPGSGRKVTLQPITPAPFWTPEDNKDPKVNEAIRATNINNLALAFDEFEAQKRALMPKAQEYTA